MEVQIFKPQKKEKWTPNKNSVLTYKNNVLTYIEATQRELEKKTNKTKRKAIQQPNKKRKHKHERTKWTKADKDGAVVIVGVKDYIKEAEWQLNNTENYRKL